MNIEITKANTKYIKERTKTHGTTMRVLQDGHFEGQPAFLLESLGKSWRGQTWGGWFLKKDIEWIVK